MALFHLHVTQVKRSAGQSVVTSAAYRAGEKLYSEYYGEVSDYTHKGGVVCTDILLPPQAPNQYQDRATLWNAVEKAERGKKAQLAYSFDIALQNEFSLEENIALARQFVSEQLVGRGMIADFAIHQPDKEDGGIPNPHFHVLCPIRPIEPDGKWGCKQRRRYRLDEDGNRIIMVDRKLLKNPNGLILGTPGSGKSFSSKREITNVFLVTEDDVLVCDPEDEYAPLVKRLGGQVVKISPTSTQYVNPMDINLNYSDDDNPLALKVDFLLSFCDIVVGSKDGLQPVEKTVIDRCVRNVYRPYLIDGIVEVNPPIFICPAIFPGQVCPAQDKGIQHLCFVGQGRECGGFKKEIRKPGKADRLFRLMDINGVCHIVFCGRLEARFWG